MNTKTCTYCKQIKLSAEFPTHYSTRDGLDNRCRQCKSSQARILREMKRNAPPKPEVCDCCKKPTTKWRIDHDHKTNQFRGWLCDSCNTGIGMLGDSLEDIIKAVHYLEKSKSNGK